MPVSTPPFPLAGELASLGASLIWSVSTSIYARFGRAVSAAGLNLLKNVVAIVCLAALGAALSVDLPRDPMLYVWLALSGVIGLALGDTALFAALKRLGAQLTSSLQCLSPPISAMIAALFLGEVMSPREVVGMLLTAGAVAGIVHFSGKERRGPGVPGGRALSGVIFALVSATCQGAQIVISRHALQEVHVVAGTAMRITPAILLLTAMNYLHPRIPADGPPKPKMAKRELAFLLVAAFLGTFCGLILMSMGAKYAKAGVAAALTATYPLWILPIARFVLKETISWQRVACTLVAVCGIIVLVWKS